MKFGLKGKMILQSIFLFLLAALFEIGGGYLVWLWLRDGMGIFLGVTGGFVLFLYGIVPTFQKSHFGRVYAAYGGVFIPSVLIWGWLIDKRKPDRPDLMGGIIALLGVFMIMYWPR